MDDGDRAYLVYLVISGIDTPPALPATLGPPRRMKVKFTLEQATKV